MRKRRSQSRYSGPGTFPPISPPGQREFRRLTMREEVLRLLLIPGAQLFLGGSILVFLYLIAAIVGPIIGVIIGFLCIVYVAKFIKWTDRQVRQLFAPVFIVLICLWLYVGYDTCQSVWMPDPIPNWPTAIRTFIVVFYLGAAAIEGWPVYMLWIEETDPNYPPPRQAILRDGPLVPLVTQETYGGQVLPEISTLPNLPSRTITVQLDKSGNGKHTESVAHIPDQSNWHQFFYAVAHHGKGFTEATAKAYSVPLNDVKDQAGQLIVVGMRTLREQFIARGWLEWKNPGVHERGLRVTEKGQVVMEAIGKESG